MKADDFEEVTKRKTTSKKKTEPETLIVKKDAPEGFYELTELPSKFKLYPAGTQIFSRPLKILEVKQLASMSADNYNSIINNVLKKSVKGINIDDLVTADKLYIIFWQRANTYRGDGFSIDFKCNLCDTDAHYDFDISQIQLSDIPDDYDENKTYVTPVAKDVITFKQLIVKDERLIESYSKIDENADDELMVLAAVIKTINGEEMNFKSKYEFITNMAVHDTLFLNKKYKDIEISINPIANVKCSNCGGEAQTPITFRSDFFLPEYKD